MSIDLILSFEKQSVRQKNKTMECGISFGVSPFFLNVLSSHSKFKYSFRKTLAVIFECVSTSMIRHMTIGLQCFIGCTITIVVTLLLEYE